VDLILISLIYMCTRKNSLKVNGVAVMKVIRYFGFY